TFSLVEFFADGVKIGDDTAAPYSFVWPSPAPGTHRLTAVGTLTAGGQVTSPAVTIQVLPAPVPTVVLSGVTDQRTVVLPATPTRQATLAPAGPTISSAQFLINNEEAGEVSLAPYSLPVTIPAPGAYTIAAVAVTATGTTYTSAVAHVTFAQPAAGEQLVS